MPEPTIVYSYSCTPTGKPGIFYLYLTVIVKQGKRHKRGSKYLGAIPYSDPRIRLLKQKKEMRGILDGLGKKDSIGMKVLENIK